MTKLKALPRSRAKTAWGLCQDVKRAILDEPKRVDMTCYVAHKHPTVGGPACGTVGCFAGWVGLLQGYSSIGSMRARLILGEDLYYDTVGPSRESVFNEGSGDSCDTTTPGTRAHARAVVARINRFMKVNEAALKARKLPVRTN